MTFSANTIMGLDGTVKEAAAALMSHYHDSLLISSGCTLFTRFVLRVSTDIPVCQLLLTSPLGCTLTFIWGDRTTICSGAN
jgi:hypothetical protein